uniref:DUF4252 domain-containing protein n=1 Tax=Roseihalotalea indica TaxID=2867963 RepID=A0AA49GRJ1_9BACT|nr:DUF4252 domain-containing protein [Tunicatimonas sp. TK19036]
MKRLIIIIAAIHLLALSVNAQDNALASLFDKFSDNEDFTKVTITSKMFSLFTEFEPEDPETQELTDAISKLKGLKILASDSIDNAQQYYKDATSQIRNSSFEELMSVRDGKEDMLFMIQEDGGKISELVMLVGGAHKFVAMSLYGEIDLKQISKISKGMKVNGMEYLENIDHDHNKEDKHE